jgi:release factor glutamine methyltransferase
VSEDYTLQSLFEKLRQDSGVEIKVLRRMAANVKGLSYEKIFLTADKLPVALAEKQQIFHLLARYESGEPLSKILNSKFFWKHEFFVNQNVLDPRPETELIIEAALGRFSALDTLNFLDLGTGSGCILLSLLGEFINSNGTGMDISPEAIEVALRNRRTLKIDRANFIVADWNNFPDPTEKFDAIVSNPPYVRTCDIALLDENVRKYDPKIALDGGQDGLEAFVVLARISQELLTSGGLIFFEVGFGQAEKVADLLRRNSYNHITCLKDFNGIDRVVSAEK